MNLLLTMRHQAQSRNLRPILRQLLIWLALFTFGAVLASAQLGSVTAQAPPGTSSADITAVVGWARYFFGIIAVGLVIWGAVSLISHHGNGVFQFLGALACILIAGSAGAIVTALYHGGTG